MNAMITKFSVKSFKALSSTSNIELKPITIICGKNSSGKSSIIQSLLLLKQTLLKPDFNGTELLLEGEYLHYSHLSDIAHNKPHPNTSKIEYSFEVENEGKFIGSMSFLFKQSSYVKKSKKGPYVSEIKWFDGDNNHKIALKKEKLIIPKKSLLEIVGEKAVANKKLNYELALYHFLPQIIESIIEKGTDDAQQNRYAMYRNGVFYKLCQSIHNDISSISYLSPIRAYPQRAYLQFSTQNSELEIDGSNCAQYLFHNRDKRVKFQGRDVSLLDGVNASLKVLGLDQTVSVKRTNRILYQLIAKINEKSKKEVPISDVGFGYSQVIPMIIKGLISRKNNITIYEQPEIHLHPASAGRIADVLLLFANEGRRSIVETHSAEMINRLRLNLIEKPELKEMVNIVFVDKDQDGKTIVKQFQFDEEGMPPEWPSGFLDESQIIAEKIINARIGK